MARDQHMIVLTEPGWTELTDGDAQTVTFQVLTGAIEVRGTPDATPPAVGTRGLVYNSGGGELAVSMSVLFARGDCKRLFARPVQPQSEVMIDHV